MPENELPLPAEEAAAPEEVAYAEVRTSDEITQVVGAANDNGGEYAPLVAVVLAGIAVLGGQKAWNFYSERSEQKHKLELRKLDIQEKAAGLGAAQPPPCQTANAKLEAEMASLTERLAAVEKKSSSFSADFDGDEVNLKLRKLTRAVKSLQSDRDEL